MELDRGLSEGDMEPARWIDAPRVRFSMAHRTWSSAFVIAVLFAGLVVAAPSRGELLVRPIVDFTGTGSGASAGYPAGIPLPNRTLILTIDDGPGILSQGLGHFLNEHGIRATFFVNGNRIDALPGAQAIFAELTSLGHQIANHTETHFRLPNDPSRASTELRTMETRIAPHLTTGLHAFRPPYAAFNAAVLAALDASGEFGLLSGPFLHELDANDWSCRFRGRTPTQCADDYLVLLLNRPTQNGMIIVHELVSPEAPNYHREVIEALVFGIKALPGPPFVWVTLDAIAGVTGGLTAGPAVSWSSGFSDAAGFGADIYASTLRAGDVDGDGDDDVCARRIDGVVCALSNGATLAAPTLWSPTFSNAAGFGSSPYASTLQLADVNGDDRADLCIRSLNGLVCETSNGVNGFVASAWTTADFSDAAGYGASESRYRSLRFGDVDGDGRADACARDGVGVRCARSTATGFAAATLWSARLGDAEGFDPAEYGATLALGDLDGDGKADLCVRGPDGVACGRSDGIAFADPVSWLFPGFTDAEGWTARSRFLSIRLRDVNGDGRADVCGRNANGVECANSTGTRFVGAHYAVNTDFLDSQGWSAEPYGATLLLARLDGTSGMHICGRAVDGLSCHRAPIDPDGDGVGNPRDNCPMHPNADQRDTNKDGVGNACSPNPPACGLGAELLLLMPLLWRVRRSRHSK
jgi:peptidoglycan/xylan/chitin deacetylase (PgdA/CDA1 family)